MSFYVLVSFMLEKIPETIKSVSGKTIIELAD